MERSNTRAYLQREVVRIDGRIKKYLIEIDENYAVEEDIDKERIRMVIEELWQKKELKERGNKNRFFWHGCDITQ